MYLFLLDLGQGRNFDYRNLLVSPVESFDSSTADSIPLYRIRFVICLVKMNPIEYFTGILWTN